MYQVIIRSRILNNLYCVMFKNTIQSLAPRVEVHEPLEEWEVGQLLGGN